MTTYLVTGAQGFLGRYLVAHLLESDTSATVVGLGRSPRDDSAFTHHILLGKRNVSAPLPAALSAAAANPRYRYVPADLEQLPHLIAVLREVRPQVIFHLASALRDDAVDSLFHINVVGSVRLLEAVAAAQLGHPRVVFSSSGGVYGVPAADALPLDEQAACRPNDLYSISKLAAESALRLIARQAQIPLIVGRVFNVLGPGQDERHVCGRILSQLTAIQAGVTGPCVQLGALETTRDFIDVRDVASALMALADRGTEHEVYNVASGAEASIATVLDCCLRLTQQEGQIEIRRLPPRPLDIPRHFGSRQRLAELGFTPSHSLTDSLAAILDYYQHCWSTLGDAPSHG
ncbi:MAG: NAD-dependent epimerase/dehydratase family protein [Pirellulales bacterium]